MNDQEKRNTLVDILSNIGYEPRSYSGRGMYGSECVAVSCEDSMELLFEVIEILYYDYDDNFISVLDVLRRFRTDELGLNEIIYWPGIKWQLEE